MAILCGNFDKFKVDIETMRTVNCVTSFKFRSDFCFVKALLDFIWSQIAVTSANLAASATNVRVKPSLLLALSNDTGTTYR